MIDTGPESAETRPVGPHDHAWRRVSSASTDGGLTEYRCDLCPLTWPLEADTRSGVQ